MVAQKSKNLGILIFLFFFMTAPVLHAEVVDKIIATVNQEPVTLYELNQAMANIEKELNKNPNVKFSSEEMQELKKRAFDHLVDEVVLNQEISKKGLDVTDQDVNKAIQNILERNKFSTDQLKKELASKGESYDTYREDIKNQLKRLKFINQLVGNKVHVTDEDVAAFYAQNGAQLMGGNQEVHIAQIVLPTQSDAEKIYQKIKGGMKFEQAMKDFGAAGSGDLGKVGFSGINPQLASAIQGLPQGGVTSPIQTDAGYLLVKLYDKPQGELAGGEDIKNRVKDKIYEMKLQEEIKKYVEQLRSKAFIDVKTGI